MTNPTPDITPLITAALELSETQRAAMALQLLESLDGPADPDVEEAWNREISRRVHELRADKAKTISASKVRERILARLSSQDG